MTRRRQARRREARRVTACLLASAVLHLVAVLLAIRLPAGVERQVLRPRLQLPVRLLVQRLTARPAVAVSRALLERVRGAGSTLDIAAPESGAAAAEAPPDLVATARPLPIEIGARSGWEAKDDALPPEVLHQDQATDLPAVDLVELDAVRRERNAAIVDPETGKLRGGREPASVTTFLRRGFKLPTAVPLDVEMHWYFIGECDDVPPPPLPGAQPPDPIHARTHCPARHILDDTEMARYSFLDLWRIDVESLDAMVDYLAHGGFALLQGHQFTLTETALRQRYGDRVGRAVLGLEHPSFHSYFDITRYWEPNRHCPQGVGPLPAITLDGRVVATSGVKFNQEYPCPGNQLWVNFHAFALIQPSPMGGRFRAAAAGDSP